MKSKQLFAIPTTHPFIPKFIEVLAKDYSGKKLLNDMMAGLLMGVIAIPLAIAFAIAGGVSPERGIYTVIIGGFLISLLGGSRYEIGGPSGVFVVVAMSVIERQGLDGLLLATAISGFLLIALGVMKLGSWIKFIPYPVTTGFTAGISLLIFSSQVKDFFGLKMGTVPSDFLEKWFSYLQAFPTIDPVALAVGMGSLLLIVFCRKFVPRVPGPVVAMLFFSFLVWILQLPVDTIGTRFGGVPSHFPELQGFGFSLEKIRRIMPDAITLAMLAAIECLLCGVVADGLTGDKHKSNCELVAQGIANITCSLFGALPCTGALMRTKTNINSGAKSPLSGMIHAVTVLIFLISFASFGKLIPMATLSAILFAVAWNMSEVRQFRLILRGQKSDVAVLVVTFLLTILVDLTVAVEVGVVLASLLFMKRMADSTQVELVKQISDEAREVTNDPDAIQKKTIPPGVEVFEMNGPFFFGAADLLSGVLGRLPKTPKVFVLRMRKVPSMDATGAHALGEFSDACTKKGTQLVLSGVNSEVASALIDSGLNVKIGQQNIFNHINAALVHAKKLVS